MRPSFQRTTLAGVACFVLLGSVGSQLKARWSLGYFLAAVLMLIGVVTFVFMVRILQRPNVVP